MKALLATSGGVLVALLHSWVVVPGSLSPVRLPEWAERLGWTLVHSVWQLAAVAVVAALVDLGLRRRSANARYAVGVAALLMMVALPCVTWTQVVIASRVGGGEGSSDDTAAVGWDQRRFAAPAHHDRETNQDGGPVPEAGWSHPTEDGDTVLPSAERPDDGRVAGVGASSRNPGGGTQLSGSSFAEPQSSPGHPSGWSRFIEQIRVVVEPRLPLFVVLWLVGVVVCSLRPVWGLWTQWRLRRVGLSPVSDELQKTLNDIARRVSLTRVVRIAQSACVTVPMVVGYLRPMILLPASVLTGLTPTQLESLLAHELAHVRRHDWLVNAVQVVVETLLFYHPAVWWLSNRIRYERELCCDDIALKVIGDKATYGRMLLALEELRHVTTRGTLTVPASLAATGGSLVARIRRLMPSQSETQRASRGWLSGAVALAVLALSCGVWFATQATAENGGVAKKDVTKVEVDEAKENAVASEKNGGLNSGAEAPHPRPLSPQSRGEGSEDKSADAAGWPGLERLRETPVANGNSPGLPSQSLSPAPATPSNGQATGRRSDQATVRAAPAKFDATGEILRHVTARRVGLKDWPEWCGSPHRNNAPAGEDIPTTWNLKTGENVLWKVEHKRGNMTTPVIANGKVYVAGNNQSGANVQHPKTEDLGCLRAHDAATGELLWQATHPKLARGKDGAFRDWSGIGICSPPTVEGERLWYVSNRGDVVCLDTEGFRDGENDGPIVDEAECGQNNADFIWQVDLVKEFGIEPHLVSASAILCVGDRLFVITSNGVDASHTKIPNPNAPSFVSLDKNTGKVLWTDNSPGGNILAGCWSSPCAFEINGETQIVMPGGDGWLYSFTPDGDGQGHAKLLWKFDVNLKESKFTLATGRSERNSILATPVYYDGLVYVGVGSNPEHGEGAGVLWCIDPTKRGDVSTELAVDAKGDPLPHRRIQAVIKANGERAIPNPNTAMVWGYKGSSDLKNGKPTFEGTMHRTLGNVAIKNDLLFVSDYAGLVHCLDAKPTNGHPVVHWTHDLACAAWGTPLIVEDKVYIGNEDGDVTIFALSKTKQVISTVNCGQSIQTTPVVANDTLYIDTVCDLIAIKQKPKLEERPQPAKAGSEKAAKKDEAKPEGWPGLERLRETPVADRANPGLPSQSLSPAPATQPDGIPVHDGKERTAMKDPKRAKDLKALVEDLSKVLPEHWKHPRIVDERTIEMMLGMYLPVEQRPHVIVAFTDDKIRPKVRYERDDEQYEYLGETRYGHTHLFISMKSTVSRLEWLDEHFAWPEATEFIKAYLSGDTQRFEAIKIRSDDRLWVSNGWGLSRSGLRLKWSRMPDVVRLQKPILVHLTVQNFGKDAKSLDRDWLHPAGTWMLTGPDGKPVSRRMAKPAHTPQPLVVEASSSASLAEWTDLAELFEITATGRYVLSMDGKAIPKTNVDFDFPDAPDLAFVIHDEATQKRIDEYNGAVQVQNDKSRQFVATADPEKYRVMVGEPIWIHFHVSNQTDTDKRAIVGGDYRNRLGRPNSFKVDVFDADGQRVVQPDSGLDMGGISHAEPLPAKKQALFKLFLPHWVTITKPGKYRMTIWRELDVVPSEKDGGQDAFAIKPEKITVAAETTFTVVPPDEAKFGALIDQLGPKLVSENSDDSENADRMLQAIRVPVEWSRRAAAKLDVQQTGTEGTLGTEGGSAKSGNGDHPTKSFVVDERAVPWYVKYLTQPRGSRKQTALHFLAHCRSETAFRAIVKAFDVTAADITDTTRRDLAESSAKAVHHVATHALATYAANHPQHPEATSKLFSLADHAHMPVRLTILHFCATNKSPQARKLIDLMTNDKDPTLATEAKRYQNELAAEQQQPPVVRGQETRVEQDAASQKVRAALRQTTETRFVENHVTDAIRFLSELHDIKVELDETARRVLIEPVEKKVTLTVDRDELSSALMLLLHPFDLSYCVDEGRLLIATPDEIRRRGMVVPTSLRDALKKLEQYPDVRWEAVLLGQIAPEDFQSVPKMITALSDKDTIVQRAAADALDRLAEGAALAIPALQTLSKSDDVRVRFSAYRALVAIGREDLRTLPWLVDAWPRDEVVRERWWDLVERYGEKKFDEFAKLYPAADVSFRKALLSSMLGRTNVPERLILLGLNDADENLRLIALVSMLNVKPTESQLPVLRTLLQDNLSRSRTLAAHILLPTDLDSELVRDVLLKATADGSDVERDWAVGAFTRLPTSDRKRVISQLNDVLLKGTEDQRRGAWEALAHLELLNRREAASLTWGPKTDGVRTRISLDAGQATLGQPIRLRLEIENLSPDEIAFDDQPDVIEGTLNILNADTSKAEEVAIRFSTKGVAKTLVPDGILTCAVELDPTKQLRISKVGRYAIQFRSKRFPTSNMLVVKFVGENGELGQTANPKRVGPVNDASVVRGQETRAEQPQRSPEQAAIDRAVQFLKSKQQADGMWHEQGEVMTGGKTALAMLSLLQAGVKPDDAAIQKGLPKLRQLEANSVYIVALQTMVLCAATPQQDADVIRRNVAWLEKAQAVNGKATGGWRYQLTTQRNDADGSNTRFAVMALDAAKRAKFEVGAETWQRVATYWLKGQLENGGFGYTSGPPHTYSMTLAGAWCLATANQYLPQDDQSAAREAAIKKGVQFASQYRHTQPPAHPLYTNHCLKLAGHLFDLHGLGHVDWRSPVVKRLVEGQRADGAWMGGGVEDELIGTSFALMFLSQQPDDKGGAKPVEDKKGASTPHTGSSPVVRGSPDPAEQKPLGPDQRELRIKARGADKPFNVQSWKTNDQVPPHRVTELDGGIDIEVTEGTGARFRFQADTATVTTEADRDVFGETRTPVSSLLKIRLKGKVLFEHRPRLNGKLVTLTAERMEADLSARTLTAEGSVTIGRDDESLKADGAKFDFEKDAVQLDRASSEKPPVVRGSPDPAQPPTDGLPLRAPSPATSSEKTGDLRSEPRRGQETRAEQEGPSIRGRVMIDGPIPVVPPLKIKPSFRAVNARTDEEERREVEREKAAPVVEIPDVTLVIGKAGGLANVAVYLKKAPKDWKPAAPATDPLVIEAANHRFSPHMAFIRVKQPLKLKNSLNENAHFAVHPTHGSAHNVLFKPDNDLLIESPYKQPESLPNRMNSNLHPWMTGYLLALDHPFAAITDAEGQFEIRGLPPGEHHFTVWHERLGYLDKDLTVRVTQNNVASVDLKYEAEQFQDVEADIDIKTLFAERKSRLDKHEQATADALVGTWSFVLPTGETFGVVLSKIRDFDSPNQPWLLNLGVSGRRVVVLGRYACNGNQLKLFQPGRDRSDKTDFVWTKQDDGSYLLTEARVGNRQRYLGAKLVRTKAPLPNPVYPM